MQALPLQPLQRCSAFEHLSSKRGERDAEKREREREEPKEGVCEREGAWPGEQRGRRWQTSRAGWSNSVFFFHLSCKPGVTLPVAPQWLRQILLSQPAGSSLSDYGKVHVADQPVCVLTAGIPQCQHLLPPWRSNQMCLDVYPVQWLQSPALCMLFLLESQLGGELFSVFWMQCVGLCCAFFWVESHTVDLDAVWLGRLRSAVWEEEYFYCFLCYLLLTVTCADVKTSAGIGSALLLTH